MNYSGYNPNQPQQQQSYYEFNQSHYQPQPYDQSYASAYQPSYYAATPYTQHYAPYYPSTVDFTSHYHHQQQQQQQQQRFLHYQHPEPVHPLGVIPEPLQQNNIPIGPSSPEFLFRQGGHGRGQGHFSHGRGRGRGGGRHFPSHSSGLAISDVPGASAAGATVQAPPRKVSCEICKVECNAPEVMETHLKGRKHLKNVRLHEEKQRCDASSGLQSDQIQIHTSRQNSTDQSCEICKVEYNAPEVMETHLKGRKHLKNVRLHEEKQRCDASSGPQSDQIQIHTSQQNSTDQSLIAQDSEYPTKNTSSEIAADNHKIDIMSQNNVGETSNVPAEETEGFAMGNSGARGRGLKRKLRGKKGSKLMRTVDGSKSEVVAITCELCNVKCETQKIYQSHFTGKKHLRRASGHHVPTRVGNQALSGVVGLQALYPPDMNALANAINAQVQQGDNDPQVLLAQLLLNALSKRQGSATATPNDNNPLPAQMPTPAPVTGSSHGTELAQTQQASETAAPVGIENPSGESNNEILSVPVESNAQEGSNVTTQIEGGSSETK